MGASGPSAASIADSSPALANRPSAVQAPPFPPGPTRLRKLSCAHGLLGAPIDYNKVPPVRQSGTACKERKIGSHSPHYALKVAIPRGAARRIAVPVPPCAAIREEACFVRSWPLFAGCSRTFRLGGGPVASRGSGARQIRPGDFRGRLRGLPSRRPGPCLRDESHGPDGSPAPALYDRPRTREPSRGLSSLRGRQ